jgi:hypothetical protein
MMKLLPILTALFMLTNAAFAQSNLGGIYGKVLDEKKQGLDFASVTASEGGQIKGGAKTDLNGNYKIKGLAPGRYEVKVTFVGYKESITRDVIVQTDKLTNLDLEMEKRESKSATQKEVVIKDYKRKLIDPDGSNTNYVSKEVIRNNSSAKIGDLVGLTTGVVQTKAGSQNLNINGGRSDNTLYMIDGMMIRPGRSVNLPQNAINDIELFTNGLSAKYGNATGGIVAINTRGITPVFTGSLQAQHSIEGFNNNNVSLDMAGPILRKKGAKGVGQPVMGFSMNLGFTYDKDPDPSFDKYTRLKPEVLKRIQENPLVPNPNGIDGNYAKASELVTADDFERIKARENGDNLGFTYQGKLDFQPADNVNVTLGTYALYGKSSDWRFTNSLFAPEANPIREDLNLRGFIRLTQKLGKALGAEKQDGKKSPITDAFYSLQFTYQRDFINGSNPVHKQNTFNYGYLGQFKQHRSDFYRLADAVGGYRGISYVGQSLDSVTFSPGGINPLLENYTKAIFNSGQTIRNLDQIRGLFGLRNGDSPFGAYDMWTGSAQQIVNYFYQDADQIQLNLDASLDIEQGGKNKKRKDPITHNIQFGLGYDQRSSSSYSLSAANLWSIMRQNTNQHFKNLDLDNPIFVVNGAEYTRADLDAGVVQFSPFDTIRYNQLYVESEQTRIDKELRNKLYGNTSNTNIIDIDNLDPSTFNINMFSADDLFNNGNEQVTYFGYDYLGNKLTRQPSFNDFWTKKDARGDFERPIGAFRPIYMFGYLLDKFSYKDLKFNIGLRIDRYDANQKVLKDPYSLYGVRKAGDIAPNSYTVVEGSEGQGNAPAVSSFSDDYVVYVDNNQSDKPKVVGYRDGDVWYNPFGEQIADPTVLSGLYNSGLPIEPWLVTRIDSLNGIKGRNYDPNNSFEDYKPQIALSPRIQFSFPISDNALFYGNYDVVTQTPTGANFVTPDDYYFLYERQQSINNANLRMERAIKYSLGYQQRITSTAAMIIESFYQERRNQIQLQQFLLAYPQSYSSFGNRDFSSTKGMTVKLDFRRSGPMRMLVAYTLQFAEGTGSNATSQRSLLATGQPNLRSVLPLDFDSRHIFNVSFDYRYDNDKNKGPELFGRHPFENAGLNLVFRTNSGTPYTRSSLATPVTGGDFNSIPIVGTLNGSRKPWVTEIGLRVDKSFKLGDYGELHDKENKELVIRKGRPIFLNIYCNVQNLLNTRNLLNVYRYTGVGSDDGFLTSPQGIQFLSAQQFQDSYIDLYNTRLNNPANFNNPRRIALGVLLEF